MDYEKAYKEALERAKNLQENSHGMILNKWLTGVFPELAKPEDEKIKEDLIQWINEFPDTIWRGHYKKDIISWLEKQGESNFIEEIKRRKELFLREKEKAVLFAEKLSLSGRIAILEELLAFANKKQGDKKPIMNVPTREVILSIWDLGNEWKELTNGVISTKYGTQLDYIQKHWHESEYYLREKQGEKKATEMKSPEESLGVSSKEYNEIVNECLYGESKPADKVEPKFKVGDWVVNRFGDVWHIDSFDSKNYQVSNENKYCYFPIKKQDEMNLWSIQDAKDGDVLVNGSNIFIFHFINETRLMGYCHVNTDDGRFYDDIGKNECFCLVDAVIYPAGKEQHDLLFVKMKEAGYQWDANKMELRKIGQNPAWSDKDEEMCKITLSCIETLEDISNGKNMHTDIIDWLKSLKYRATWKPSKEQMDALLGVMVESGFNYIDYNILESLYNDLKKL